MYLELLDKMLSNFDFLKVNQELCVHTISPKATCQKCVEVCPTKAIKISEKIEVGDTCTACGACVASCPENVFKITDPSDKYLLENIKKTPIITCTKNAENIDGDNILENIIQVTCLSRLYYELLFFMAMENDKTIYLWINDEYCSNCINNKNIASLKSTIASINKFFDKEKISVVNKFPNKPFKNTVDTSQQSTDRRGFFKNVYFNVKKVPQEALISLFDEKINESQNNLQETLRNLQNTKNKKRELLLKSLEKITLANNLNPNIDLPINKMEIKRCYLCEVCVKVCPSGALQSKDNTLEINYKKCTNCGFCKDICINKSITFGEQISIAEIMAKDYWQLVKTTTHICENCGIEYKADSKNELCLKCSLQKGFK